MSETKVPIFNTERFVVVVIGTPAEIEEVVVKHEHRERKKGFAVNCFNEVEGICFTSAPRPPVIGLPKIPRTPREIGVLVHEAVHAIEDVFGGIRAPIGGEIFAESIEAIVRETLKAVRR